MHKPKLAYLLVILLACGHPHLVGAKTSKSKSSSKGKSTARSKSSTKSKSGDSASAAQSDEKTADKKTAELLDSQLSFGKAQAPFVIYEFSNIECPVSALYAGAIFPLVKRDFVDTGKVRYDLRAMWTENHPHAVMAEAAARCAGEQGKYWEMRKRLFSVQQGLNRDVIMVQAKALGIDMARFTKSFDNKVNEARILKERDGGMQSSVTVTPTLILVRIDPATRAETAVWWGKQPRDYQELKRNIDRAIQQR